MQHKSGLMSRETRFKSNKNVFLIRIIHNIWIGLFAFLFRLFKGIHHDDWINLMP